MFERFTGEARDVVKASHDEARAQGSATVEAEHLLLALSREPAPTRCVLEGAGLDGEAIRAALAGELDDGLAAVGVSAPGLDELEPAAPAVRSPRFAASAKLALERSVRVAQGRGDRRLVAGHILLGILHAEVGTVPRALHVAGVDPAGLALEAEAAVAG